MKVRDFPPMQSALDVVKPLLPSLSDAVEAATLYGRGCHDDLRKEFASPSLPLDPWYFPHSVRLYLRLFFSQNGIFQDVQLDELPNSGLRFHIDGWEVRIRKATRDDAVPPAGHSKTMQGFYRQTLWGEPTTYTGRNLLLLWHVDSQGKFTALSVAYPVDGDILTANVYWHVKFTVADTLAQIMGQMSNQPPTASEILDLGDLDMELDGVDDDTEEFGSESAQ